MTWILFLLLLLLVILIAVWWLTYRTLFCPDKVMHGFPAYKYNDIYIEIDGDSTVAYNKLNRPSNPCLNMWYFDTFNNKDNDDKDGNKGNRTVLFFHGNSGNISHRDYVIDVCKEFGLNLLLVDYRGYGKSDGVPNTRGIRRDCIQAYDFLASRCDPNDIVVWGESLGGSAAVYVAAHRQCRCLILISTFSCLEDCIFDSNLPKWFRYPIGYLIKWTVEPIPSDQWLMKVRCPVSIIHSVDDDLICFSNAVKMFDSVRHDCKMLVPIKGKHSAPIITEEQLEKVFSFVEIDTCSCQPEKKKQLLDNIRTVAVRKGLTDC